MTELEVRAEVKAHALSEPHRECCGLILCTNGDFSVKRCVNESPSPTDTWIIDTRTVLDARKSGTLHSCYHSHVKESSEPSEADKRMSEDNLLPFLIYSLAADSFSLYEPQGYQPPLEGRRFALNIHDCVSLVEDYYHQEFGIELGYRIRSLRDMNDGISVTEVGELCRQCKLRRVYDPKPGDILLIDIDGIGKVNHAAIYLDDQTFLHQLRGAVSGRQVYGRHWRQRTLFILRHNTKA